MRPHGGYPPARLEALDFLPTRERAQPGYRNMFGKANEKDVFRGYGLDTQAQIKETERMLKAVAYRMCCPYAWKDELEPNVPSIEDNPNLPSGYTYLTQLVVHDLSFVHSARPQAPGTIGNDDRNLRAAAMELDTVYGGAPFERPFAYCPAHGKHGPERTLLRLGYYKEKSGAGGIGHDIRRARDVPRVDVDFVNDAVDGMADVLLADPRNDDQPVVAQMFVLFALLHNAVCAILRRTAPVPPAPQPDVGTLARNVVRFVYRRIIERDLLKRLLNKDVYKRYAVPKPPYADKEYDGRMAVEFSHGACRMGHVMVRQSYRFNKDNVFSLSDMLRENSTFNSKRMPLPAEWIIQWSRYFEIGSRPSNLSRRLGPSLAPTLLDGAQFDGEALPYRDFLRGASWTRSVASLIENIGKKAPDIVLLSPWVQDLSQWKEALEAWLDQPSCGHPYLAEGGPITDKDREILAADPPLLLYVLLEAAVAEKGERLGVLGSVIVAETAFRALRNDPSDSGPAADDVAKLADQVFEDDVPFRMRQVIEFLDRHYEFHKSSVPFK